MLFAMNTDRARAIAEQLHAAHREEDGTLILEHIRRVAEAAPAEARVVAWLHEALEAIAITEHDLLAHGVTTEQLRALRLLEREADSRSDDTYLAHVDVIARAAGRSGRLARMVKIADLEDRRLHPRVRPDGWSPPYARGLRRLHDATRGSRDRLTSGARHDESTRNEPDARSLMTEQTHSAVPEDTTGRSPAA